jgi:predicted nucleic acid-binding protein
MNISLSTQNLSEFYYNVTKKIKNPLGIIEAKEIISGLISLSNIKIIKINNNTVLNAIDISSEYNLSYWDALIVSVMKENNIYSIITENDKDFNKIPWLKVNNPFVK